MEFFSFLQKKKKVGLSLSGGGMRGVAHIAVLQALEEYGLKPSIISGTSAGAIIGAFYSLGKTPAELLEMVQLNSFFSRSSFHISRKGIFNPEFLIQIFQKNFPEDDFRILKIPFYAAATELTEGKINYFSEGKLFDVLLASASVPFIFPPVILNDKFYVDGGVLNNLPTEIIQDKCDFLIGSHVNAMGNEAIGKMNLSTEFDRILHLAISSSVYSKSTTCDLFINPPDMLQYSLFRKDNLDTMLAQTYQYTVEKLEDHGFRKIKNRM